MLNEKKCPFCWEEPLNNKMIKIHLNHYICSTCFNNYLLYQFDGYLFATEQKLLEHHLKYPFEMIKCPIRQCNYFFEIQKINAFTEVEINNEKINFCKAKQWIPRSHEQRWCPLCNTRKYLDDFAMFKNCRHYVCIGCFKLYTLLELSVKRLSTLDMDLKGLLAFIMN